MKYCVLKNTIRPIAQGEDEEFLNNQALENMLDGKYLTLEDIEILTEEEYEIRKSLESILKELTIEERLQQLETLTVNNISNQIENQIMKGEL